jgi:HTH-type transcriptional regulator / antitoxin HipB
MDYPIKILDQLPIYLKAFRKKEKLTQADMADKLGITQQAYAQFEANPASASVERTMAVLEILGAEIKLTTN